MDALPTAVGHTTEIELTGRHEDLFDFAVELVAVDVEVFNAQASYLALIDEETGFHLSRVEEAHVRERIDVGLNLGSGERAELHFADANVGQAECFASRLDVALNERRFACFLVWIDDERLDDGWIDHATDDGNDEPQCRGEERQTPRVGP